MGTDHRGRKVGDNHQSSFKSTHRIHSEGEYLSPEDAADNEYWDDHYKHHQLGYPAEEFRDKGYPDSFFEEK